MPKWPPEGIPNELLKHEREKCDWTQKDVADKVGGGVDARLVRKWESGATVPGPHNRQKLAELFGKNAKELGFPPEGEIPFWYVPYRRNEFFTGRKNILQQLRDTFLAQQASSAPRLPLALTGLGGVGKTQIALEYAYCCRDQYYNHTVLWIHATSSQQLSEDFIAVADLLELPEKDADNPDVRIGAVKTWLKQLTRWLLIFDNVDNFQLLDRFLPDEINGHVLLTTRSQSTGQFASRSILVEPLDDHVGAELLLHKAKILPLECTLEQAAPTDVADARSYSKNVGGLPLALDQAGAYIEETDVSLADYLERYEKNRRDLLNKRGRGSQQSPSQHPESVIATLELSFTNARNHHPLAGDLLNFCAFLQPDAMPEDVLLLATGPQLDILSLDGAVAALLAYSLIRRNTQAKTFSMHRLVQEVLIDDMSSDLRKQWRARVVRALTVAFPEVDFKDWGQCARLLSHVLICAMWTEDELTPTPGVAELLHKAGVYLRERGQYADAAPLLVRACSLQERLLGAEHLDTAAAQHDLGLIYWRQGRYEQAWPLLQRAHAIREQHLGTEHPDTAKSLNSLASLYNSQGEYEQAEAMYRQALSVFERLGDELDKARSLNNLAELYEHMARYGEAEELYQQALHIKRALLGSDHHSTAASLNNLSYLYVCMGKYDQSEQLYLQALSIFEQCLGSTHHYTVGTLNNLAEVYWLQGKYEQAESLYQRALALRKQHLGAEHPETAETLYGLAKLRQSQGNIEEAADLYQRALSIQAQQLGPTHLYTQETRKDYAAFLCSIGRDAEAVALESGNGPPK